VLLLNKCIFIEIQNDVNENAEIRSNPAKLLKLVQITQVVLQVLNKHKYLVINYNWIPHAVAAWILTSAI